MFHAFIALQSVFFSFNEMLKYEHRFKRLSWLKAQEHSLKVAIRSRLFLMNFKL